MARRYIDKDAVVAEIERRIESCAKQREDMLNAQCHTLADDASARIGELRYFQDFLNTLEVIDPYEQCIQYPTVKDGIEAHAEVYSFNIESELFNQLTKEQQKLWRKEIEQACISGGDAGYLLARDPRYKENLEVEEVNCFLDTKEVDLKKEVRKFIKDNCTSVEEPDEFLTTVMQLDDMVIFAKHFFELGLKVRKEESK